MNSTPKDKALFRTLFIKSFDGRISDDEIQQFNTLLVTFTDLQDYYVKCVQLQAGLCDLQAFNEFNVTHSPMLDSQLWHALAEYEKTADEIDVPQPEPETPLIQKVIYKKSTYKVSKSTIYSAIISAAAILCIVLFITFAPDRKGPAVATLTDTINAQWAPMPIAIDHGVRLPTGVGIYELRQGFARITFDSGVNLTVEAPTAFELLSDDQVELFYGRLCATVPPSAIGFSVTTTNSRIIDLGTEFGVFTPLDGKTELHVFEGKTSLISGVAHEGMTRLSSEVTAGQARSIHHDRSHVDTIPLKPHFFARMVDSKTGTVWRGKALSLANIVAGGDGFTGGNVKSGIDPSNGMVHPRPRENIEPAASESYIAVKDRPFINGVFIPNGERGANQMTSAGHTFSGFPSTDGFFFTDITAYPYVVEIQGKNADDTPKDQIEVKLTAVSMDSDIIDNPCILVHANAGITFDLEQIRQANPAFQLSAFKTRCVSPASWQGQAEFWIFLDGTPVFHCTAEEARTKQVEVEMPIHSGHKFLTLATTDGQDSKDYDWCLFTRPEISLEPRVQDNNTEAND